MNPYHDDFSAACAWDEGAEAERERIATWLLTKEAEKILIESLGDGATAGLAVFADYIRTQVFVS